MTVADPPSQHVLNCTVPPGWQQVDLPAMVEFVERLSASRQVGSGPLDALLKHVEAQGVVFVALRTRAQNTILDLVTVALPPVSAADLTLPASGQNESARSILELASGPAVLHETAPVTADGIGEPTMLQLVLCVPPMQQGAIVTGISSQPGASELLEEAAKMIAASLRIESHQSPRSAT